MKEKLKRTLYRKLVRDEIPRIIREDGGIPKTRILSAAAYKNALFEKLVEEAGEARRANGIEELMLELADVEEVLRAILTAYRIHPDDLEKSRKKRVRERGAFTEKIFLDSVKVAPKMK